MLHPSCAQRSPPQHSRSCARAPDSTDPGLGRSNDSSLEGQKSMPCLRISRRPGADMRRGLGPFQQPAPRPTGFCNGMSQRCAMPYERVAGLPVGFQWTFSGAGVLCTALPTPHPVSSIRPPLNRAHPPVSGSRLDDDGDARRKLSFSPSPLPGGKAKTAATSGHRLRTKPGGKRRDKKKRRCHD